MDAVVPKLPVWKAHGCKRQREFKVEGISCDAFVWLPHSGMPFFLYLWSYIFLSISSHLLARSFHSMLTLHLLGPNKIPEVLIPSEPERHCSGFIGESELPQFPCAQHEGSPFPPSSPWASGGKGHLLYSVLFLSTPYFTSRCSLCLHLGLTVTMRTFISWMNTTIVEPQNIWEFG